MIAAAAQLYGPFIEQAQAGRCFAVSKIVVGILLTAMTNCRVKVAMPDMRCKKLSATRSPLSKARPGPRTSAII